MREYDLVYSVVYPVGHTCVEIDKLVAAARKGDMGTVKALAEDLREQNAKLRHNARSWEVEARRARDCVDLASDSLVKKVALRSRVRKHVE